MRPCAIYARVSTDEQNHEMQLAELRVLAKARGWDVVEYVDTGSGSLRSLPERDRLMMDAQRGKLGAVVVWRFDRFARSTRQLVDALESFDSWGVEFVSVRESIDTTTAAGRLVFTVFAGIAEFERELIRERVKAGMDQARKNGTRSGRAIGRPKSKVDLARARMLYDEGRSWTRVAKVMGIPRSTLMKAIHADEEEAAHDHQDLRRLRLLARRGGAARGNRAPAVLPR